MSALPFTAPSNRDEHWRYANLRTLARLGASAAAAPSKKQIEAVASILPPALPNTARLVLLDGHVVASLFSALPAGVRIEARSLDDCGNGMAPSHPAAAQTRSADRYFAELNARAGGQTLVIALPESARLRIELLSITATEAHPHLRIELAPYAALTLIERQLPLESAAVTSTNLLWQAALGKAAVLEAARIGHHGSKAHFVETLDLEVGESAKASIVQLTDGAASSRSTAFVSHVGAEAALQWHGAAIGEAAQTHDAFVHVTHAARNARTTQVFRGIATGRARVAFNGHMRVDAEGAGTDSAQSLKGLIAGTEAEVDVRPQLEIYTDEVKASHGATVGKLDADMLFYLLSRGIPPAAAESLLKWAFVSDVLARLPCASLRAQVEASLERQLPGAAAARLLA
jgi:Fe-S cluster assembly protein SufD